MSLSRKSPRKPMKKSRIKRRARPAAKTNRIYGPPPRRRMVTSMPCAACGIEGYTVQAHVAPPGEKGTGYKAGYRWIIPLCGPHMEQGTGGWPQALNIGCHQMHDEHYEEFRAEFPDFDAEAIRQDVESRWLAFIGEQK